jgi:transcription initiation factor TFIID subunit 8
MSNDDKNTGGIGFLDQKQRNELNKSTLSSSELMNNSIPRTLELGNEIKSENESTNETEESQEPIDEIGQRKAIHLAPIEFQLSKVVRILLRAKGIDCSNEFLDQLTELSLVYFKEVVDSLRKYTEMQRRRLPSLTDTKICLRMKGVHPTALYQEAEYCKKIGSKNRSRIEAVERQTLEIISKMEASEHEYSEEDPSLPFIVNEHYEIAELVPKQRERPNYIPSFLPDLPPDYTYQNTPKYMDRMSDLKELRIKLVQESRMTEKSLYDLVEDDEKLWRKNFEQELLEMNEKEEEKQEEKEKEEKDRDIDAEKEKENVETIVETIVEAKIPELETSPAVNTSPEISEIPPSIPQNQTEEIKDPIGAMTEVKDTIGETTEANNNIGAIPEVNTTILPPTLPPTDTKPKEIKKFDFVEYAQKRKQKLERIEKEIEDKIKKREANIFMKAEKYYSPYATVPISTEVNTYFKNILHEEFKSVVKSVRKAEAHKKRKIEELLVEKARKDKLREQERSKNEFGFNFNHMNHSLDEDDSDSEDKNVPNFDFGAPDIALNIIDQEFENHEQINQHDVDMNDLHLDMDESSHDKSHDKSADYPQIQNSVLPQDDDDLEADIESALESKLFDPEDHNQELTNEYDNRGLEIPQLTLHNLQEHQINPSQDIDSDEDEFDDV